MKEFAVRTLEKATLILPGGAGQCKMAVYTAVLSAPKPRKVFLRRKDNHILKASTFYVTESGERLTEPPKKHFSFARVNIPMNDGQRAAFLASNDSVDNCWTLLGFKPRSCLNREALCCGFTKFAVPLEEPEAVTSDFFSSLHAAMLRKVVFAVARKKTLRGMPRHFALIPVEETRDARGNLLVSAGFSVLPLPWREEVRDIVIKDVGCSDPETVDLFCSLLRSMDLADFELTTESTFKSLANPVIDSIVQAIESVALETDDKPFVDPTSVETDDTETAHIASRLSELLRPAVKRPRPKRVATGKPAAGDPTDETFVRSLAAAGQLQKLTVVNLKAFLDSKNLKTNGKKQDLINRILEYYEESPAKKQAKGEAKLKVSDDDW
ncbi:MAG: hypothetical protein KVP17_001210 [Porospora cf. gigantea B]|nr:MAG: hypothetical protein KVP17_001210 [Porospora cf. gigantea B]